MLQNRRRPFASGPAGGAIMTLPKRRPLVGYGREGESREGEWKNRERWGEMGKVCFTMALGERTPMNIRSPVMLNVCTQ